jgi:DHA2 family multidrug resistance protein-like MFS transporter
LGSIGVAVYRGELGAALPAGVPREVAAVARDTLGGAVGVAGQLPEGVGGALLASARQAFTHGLQLTAGLSAAVAVGVAVLATVGLRGVPAGAQAGEQPAPAPEPAAVAQPEPEPQPEPAIQVIRAGSGCLACPGERSFSEAIPPHRPVN